jgi:hypothetical protein
MADVFKRDPGFRRLEERMQEIEKARSMGGLSVFNGSRNGRDGPENRFVCVQCGRTDYFAHQAVVSNNLHCPDCEPSAEDERI